MKNDNGDRICGFCGKSIENTKLKDLKTVTGHLTHTKCVEKVDKSLALRGIR